MCGTNNLKRSECDVVETYKSYKGKLEQIRELNPKSHIHVCPVLPTREPSINTRIFEFNKLLRTDLVRSGIRVNIVDGFMQFVDKKSSILKTTFHDDSKAGDPLHINTAGYCVLIKCIKDCIFGSKNKNKGRSYASALTGQGRATR